MDSQEKDTADVLNQAAKLPALRKVKNPERIIESLKEMGYDEKYSVLVALKAMVNEQAEQMKSDAQKTLDKLNMADI